MEHARSNMMIQIHRSAIHNLNTHVCTASHGANILFYHIICVHFITQKKKLIGRNWGNSKEIRQICLPPTFVSTFQTKVVDVYRCKIWIRKVYFIFHKEHQLVSAGHKESFDDHAQTRMVKLLFVICYNWLRQMQLQWPIKQFNS